MPDIFKTLASITAWAMFVIFWGNGALNIRDGHYHWSTI